MTPRTCCRPVRVLFRSPTFFAVCLHLYPQPLLVILTLMYTARHTRGQDRVRCLERELKSRVGLDYHCKGCGQWVSTYHNSHKRHISSCKEKLREAKEVAHQIRKLQAKRAFQMSNFINHHPGQQVMTPRLVFLISWKMVVVRFDTFLGLVLMTLQISCQADPLDQALHNLSFECYSPFGCLESIPICRTVPGPNGPIESAISLLLPPGKTLVIHHPYSKLP